MKIFKILLNVGFVIMFMLILMLIKRKHRGPALRNCNIKVKLNHNVPIVFYNLKNYDYHLIIQELGKLNFKINVIPMD